MNKFRNIFLAGLVIAAVTLSMANASTITGIGATALGKLEDAAHASGDAGAMALCVVKTTLAGTTSTNNDYGACILDSVGRMQVHDAPQATDGVSAFRVLSATSTGTTTVTVPTTLYSLSMSDEHATTDFHVKIYDKATAATSSDTPVHTYFVNAQTARDIAFPQGLALSAGLSIRCVTEAADNGTTAAGANECEVSGTNK